MKTFVIGGTRFIGPACVKRLISQGHQVAVFHRGQSHADLPPRVVEVLGDRRDEADLKSALQEFGPECVLDLCAFQESDQATLESALDGTSPRIVLVSSCDVYRNFGGLLGQSSLPIDPTPLHEGSPLRETLFPYRDRDPIPGRDLSQYDKIPIENRVLAMGGCVARLPMVYGPGDRQHRTFEYVRRMAHGRPAIIVPASMAQWKTCRAHVDNVAHAISLIVETGDPGTVYNVAESPGWTELEWIRLVAQAMSWPGQCTVVEDSQLPESLRPDSDYIWDIDVDTSKIRTHLGYSDVVPLEEAVLQTVEWQRQNSPDPAPPVDYSLEDQVLTASGTRH